MFRPVLRAVLLFVLLAGPASAADRQGWFLTMGVGADACRTVLMESASDEGAELVLKNWVGGYLSAMHLILEDTYAFTTNPERASTWVMDYCRRTPANTVHDALVAFMIEFYNGRLQTHPAVSRPPLPPPPAAVPTLPEWEQRSIPTRPVKKRRP